VLGLAANAVLFLRRDSASWFATATV